jgi:hypothetical protein
MAGMQKMRLSRPMRRARAGAFLALVATAIQGVAGAVGMTGHAAPPAIASHRDGNVAVAEELEAARHAGTVAAYDLFLARHPDHKLARQARRERSQVASRHPRNRD